MTATKINLLFLTIHFGAALGTFIEKYPLEKGVHVIDHGEHNPAVDEKLYSETLIQGGNSREDGDEYCYPKRGSTDQIKITEYEIKDEDKADEGGVAFDVSGGVGSSQVCFALRARHGRSYRYKVDVYGTRLNNGGMVNGVGTAAGLGMPGSFAGAVSPGLGGVGSGFVGTVGGFGGVGTNFNNGNNRGNFANPAASYGNHVYPSSSGNSGYGSGNTGYGSGNTGYSSGNTGYGSRNTGINSYGNGNTGYGQGTSGGLHSTTSRGPYDYGEHPRI